MSNDEIFVVGAGVDNAFDNRFGEVLSMNTREGQGVRSMQDLDLISFDSSRAEIQRGCIIIKA